MQESETVSGKHGPQIWSAVLYGKQSDVNNQFVGTTNAADLEERRHGGGGGGA